MVPGATALTQEEFPKLLLLLQVAVSVTVEKACACCATATRSRVGAAEHHFSPRTAAPRKVKLADGNSSSRA